jgi:ribosomal protein L34E
MKLRLTDRVYNFFAKKDDKVVGYCEICGGAIMGISRSRNLQALCINCYVAYKQGLKSMRGGIL